MPYDSGTGVFTRIWKFVDQFLAGDDALRASFDTALDDIADGVNDGFDDIRADLADLEASRGLYLGLDDALPTTNTEGGALVDGNAVIVGGLHYYWETDGWLPVGIDGAEALGLILLGLENTPEGRTAGRTALGLGSTALLDWDPADITGSMRARDNVVMGWGTGTGPEPGTEPILSDFAIRHDGSNTYMQVLGDGGVFLDSDTVTLRSKNGLKTGLTVLPGGAVTLRHDHVVRLSTSAIGVAITGQLSADSFAGTGVQTALSNSATQIASGQAVFNSAFGIGQTWQNFTGSRSAGTTYQNTTGKPIDVKVVSTNVTGTVTFSTGPTAGALDVRTQTGTGGGTAIVHTNGCIVPPGWFYSYSGTIDRWSELRA